MPIQPEIISRLRIPATPFMMFQGPPHVHWPVTGSAPWMK